MYTTNRPKLTFIFISLLLLITLVVISIVRSNIIKKNSGINTRNFITITPNEIIATPKIKVPKSRAITAVPTLPRDKGGGINTKSKIAKESIDEINKLQPYLPYNEDFLTSNGLKISILIPAKELQANDWTLTVNIFGINYQTEKNSEEYFIMKRSFREAVAKLAEWVNVRGASYDKIIVSWGDRAFMQERAEEWLKD